MEQKQTNYVDKAIIQQIYEQMNGFYTAPIIDGVRDESDGGALEGPLGRIYAARDRLCTRFLIPAEDRDLEEMLNGMEDVWRETAVKMFEYGVRWARREAEEK